MPDDPARPALLTWFELHGRELPWRHSREPWPILVVELMSQQTQVARVVDRWPRFLDRFPDPTACAAAPAADVIDEWSGLGYNRRAINLHRAAAQMVEQHGGKVPQELSALLALPGIGPYTARAVRVFAFETDDGVLDTNVGRVLARVEGRRLRPAEAQRLADDWVPKHQGWQWNQAMIDLGALVCRPTPDCGACPLSAGCAWLQRDRAEPDPADGSAGSSGRQSRFAGSDREGRGRLIRVLRAGPIERTEVPAVMGWPDDDARSARVLATLARDGLIELDGSKVRLPDS